MKKLKKYIISYNDNEIRIDRWLRRKFSNLPQSFFQVKLRKGIIRLNGKKVKANKIIFEKNILTIQDFNDKIYKSKFLKQKVLKTYKNDQKKFHSSIVSENDDYLILNKWKGISTQGGSKVANSIDNIIKNISNKMNLVHRLDKETSGALIISKNYRTSRYFGRLFKEKKIQKLYFAICRGIPVKKNGNINLEIKKKNNKKKIIESESKNISSTDFELIETKNGYSTIFFRPITGKMHQIRIVAKSLKCPILGDNKYDKLYSNNKDQVFKDLMLHAYGIKFFHNNKNQKYFTKLPEIIKLSLKRLNLKEPSMKNIDEYFNIQKIY